LKTLEVTVNRHSTDKVIFTALGLRSLFFGLCISLTALQVLAAFHLWKPYTFGFSAAYTALALNWVESCIAIGFASRHPEMSSEFARLSRVEGGMPDRGIPTPGPRAFRVAFVVATMLSLLWMGLLITYQRGVS